MLFSSLSQKVGLSLALEIYLKNGKLDEQVIESLSCRYLIEALSKLPANSSIFQLVLRRFEESSITCGDLYEKYRGSTYKTPQFKQIIMKKMEELTGTFEEWRTILNQMEKRDEGELRNVIIRKLGESTGTFYEWSRCFDFKDHPSYNALSKMAFKRMVKMISNAEEWLFLWEKIFWDTTSDDTPERRKKMKTVLDGLIDSFESWCRIEGRPSHCDEDVKRKILNKMITTAETIEQWHAVWNRSSPDSEFRNIAFKKMCELEDSTSD